MDRVDRRIGGVGIARARVLALAAVVAGLALSASALAALPPNVAFVAGRPISRPQLHHWMRITAKGQGGKPLIVPTDPPRFDHCIAQARAGLKNLRHASTQALRRDCRKLFTNLSDSVLDFLIRAKWHELEATRDGIVITTARVDHALAVERSTLFPKPAQFKSFLRRTGQTTADIKFRVRASLVFKALQKSEHLS